MASISQRSQQLNSSSCADGGLAWGTPAGMARYQEAHCGKADMVGCLSIFLCCAPAAAAAAAGAAAVCRWMITDVHDAIVSMSAHGKELPVGLTREMKDEVDRLVSTWLSQGAVARSDGPPLMLALLDDPGSS